MLKSYIGFLLISTIISAIAAGFDKGPIWCGYVAGTGMLLLGVLTWVQSTIIVFKTSGADLGKMMNTIVQNQKGK